MWSALEATNRSKSQQPDVLERLRSRSSDRWQQTAAHARALQAGGRPFEPGTAHPHAPLLPQPGGFEGLTPAGL